MGWPPTKRGWSTAATTGAFTLPTAASLAPYTLEFVITRPNGVGVVLANEAAPGLTLGSFERLNLSKLTVEVKPKEPNP